jgi:hypothetical protein
MWPFFSKFSLLWEFRMPRGLIHPSAWNKNSAKYALGNPRFIADSSPQATVSVPGGSGAPQLRGLLLSLEVYCDDPPRARPTGLFTQGVRGR